MIVRLAVARVTRNSWGPIGDLAVADLMVPREGRLYLFRAGPTGAPALGMRMAYVTSMLCDALIAHKA